MKGNRWIGAALVPVLGCASAVTRPPTPTTSIQSAGDAVAQAARDATHDEVAPEPPPVEPTAPPEPAPEATVWPEPQWSKILKVRPIVLRHAATYGLDPDLVCGLVWVESKFEAKARGPGGSRGLMQLMPGTGKSLAQRIGRRFTPDDPDFSIEAGCFYLRRLLDKFEGDERLALAAYNRGPAAIAERVAAGEPLSEGAEKFVTVVVAAKDKFERTIWPAEETSGAP